MNDSIRKKILIIEDDKVVAMLYRKYLERAGFEVKTVADGEEGLEQIFQWKPSGLLLDLLLPGLNGLDILAKLRAEKESIDLQVVVLTSTYHSGEASKAMNYGAKWVLDKSTTIPIQVVDLFQSIWKLDTPSLSHDQRVVSTESLEAESLDNLSHTQLEEWEKNWENPSHYYKAARIQLSAANTTYQSLLDPMQTASVTSSLDGLAKLFQSLSGMASVCGLFRLARISHGTQMLFQEVAEKPDKFTFSVQNTLASAIGTFSQLLDNGFDPEERRFHLDTNILAVDDQESARTAISLALKQAGLKTITIKNPLTAYEIIQYNDFDLIFLDIEMPEMSGIELCTLIRGLPRHQKTPIVFITGNEEQAMIEKTKQHGGDQFIAKPFLFKEMALKATLILLARDIVLNAGPNLNAPFDFSSTPE